jgi:hypothetical protein
MHKLGLLFACSPNQLKLSQIACLSKEEMDRGGQVYLYLIDQGVAAVGLEEVQRLKHAGVHLFCCAYGAKKRGIAWDDKATFGGLTILADMLSSCDSFVSFTPRAISTTNYKTRNEARRTLIIISTDPQKSHLPAEAVRIAAGLQPWVETQVDLLLEGLADKMLMPDSTELIDEKNFSDYLKLVRQWNHPLYLGPSTGIPERMCRNDKHLKKLTAKEVETLKSCARNIIHF